MKKAYILCGIPGSGKSTFANSLSDGINTPNICSADSFRYHKGKYCFDLNNNDVVMLKCKNKFTVGCCRNNPIMVCDNTNTILKTIQFYVDVAKLFKYDITIIKFAIDPKIAFKRNVHNVPEKTIKIMFEQLEYTWNILPSEWGKKQVINN